MKPQPAYLDQPVQPTPAENFPVKSWLAPLLTCAAIVLLLMIWPSDVPWGGDDHVLIKMASHANRQHHLSPVGLVGSFDYPYGPIPLQIYQALLLITHYLPTLVQLHAVLFAAVTAAALLWFTRTLNWSPWLAPMAMLSPFFWFYGRLLWDNTFAIPVGAMFLAAYIAFLRRESTSAFTIALVCAVMLPFIHPMTLPLVAAVAAHALCHRRGAFLKHWIILLIVAICAFVSCGPYCLQVAHHFSQSTGLPPPAAHPEKLPLPRPAAMAFPLLGGRLLSAYYFFDWRPPDPGLDSSLIARAARIISTLAFPLVWLGIAAAIARLRAGWRRAGPPHDALAAICILTFAFQSLLDGTLRIAPWPHYFTGTWIACVVFFWLGLRQLARFKLARIPLDIPIAIIYSLSVTLATAIFVISIHRAAGGKSWYGPTMSTQLKTMLVK